MTHIEHRTATNATVTAVIITLLLLLCTVVRSDDTTFAVTGVGNETGSLIENSDVTFDINNKFDTLTLRRLKIEDDYPAATQIELHSTSSLYDLLVKFMHGTTEKWRLLVGAGSDIMYLQAAADAFSTMWLNPGGDVNVYDDFILGGEIDQNGTGTNTFDGYMAINALNSSMGQVFQMLVSDDSQYIFALEALASDGNIMLGLGQNGTRRSYLQYLDSGDLLRLTNEYGPVIFMTGTGGTEVERGEFSSSGIFSAYAGAVIGSDDGGVSDKILYINASASKSAIARIQSSGADRWQYGRRFNENNFKMYSFGGPGYFLDIDYATADIDLTSGVTMDGPLTVGDSSNTRRFNIGPMGFSSNDTITIHAYGYITLDTSEQASWQASPFLASGSKIKSVIVSCQGSNSGTAFVYLYKRTGLNIPTTMASASYAYANESFTLTATDSVTEAIADGYTYFVTVQNSSGSGNALDIADVDIDVEEAYY